MWHGGAVAIDDPIPGALEHQARSCEALGSPTYARILEGLQDDYAQRGITHDLLHGRFERPIHDAAPLRLLAGLHALVLSGDAPQLAEHFPTAGGTPGSTMMRTVLYTLGRHTNLIDHALERGVQTNEVGRSVVLLALSHWLTSQDVGGFDLVEIGASAGLNLNFDRYFAATGTLTMGDPASLVRFSPDWFDTELVLPKEAARVVSRVGVDVAPIDVTDDAATLRLKSFVWPDQLDRFQRLAAALDVARQSPPLIERASADTWLDERSMRPLERPTVVFHSIVWQYMGEAVQDGMRRALARWAHTSSADRPLMWARMEPAGAVADVRVTVWRGGDNEEHRLAEVGYHGRSMHWLAAD